MRVLAGTLRRAACAIGIVVFHVPRALGQAPEAPAAPDWLPPGKAAIYIYRPKVPFNGGAAAVLINGERKLEPGEGEYGVLILAPGTYEIKIAGESGSWWPKDVARSIEIAEGREYFLRFFAVLPPGVRPGPHLLFNNVTKTVMGLVPPGEARIQLGHARAIGSQEYLALMVAQAARAARAAAGSAQGTADRYPKAGDKWEYRYVDATTKRSRRTTIEVKSASESLIEETIAVENAAAETRRHEPGPKVSFNRLWTEFSPYLLAFEMTKDGRPWTGVPVDKVPSCSRGGVSCRVDARIAGAGDVTTPAGTFSAVRVVVTIVADDLRRDALGQNYRRELTFWYSGQTKRVAKAAARTLSGNTIDEDYDVELVSFAVQ